MQSVTSNPKVILLMEAVFTFNTSQREVETVWMHNCSRIEAVIVPKGDIDIMKRH